MLLSPTEGEAATATEAAGQSDGPANSENVMRLVTEWADACDNDPNDVGLLYLAGHGTSMVVGGGFLLLEDFGHPSAPLMPALNLQYLLDAMSTRRAHTNFVFIDACRNAIEEQKKYVLTGIQNLVFDRSGPVLRRGLKVYYGAAPDQRAWTSPDTEVLQYGTIFLKSLLRALNQSAVELDDDGRLCVMANRLTSETARGVRDEARFLSQTYAREILGSGDGIGTLEEIPFHWPEVVPVDLEIELDPAASARSVQAFLYKVISAQQADYDRDVSFKPHPAQINGINSGKYRLQVSRPPRATMHDWFVMPYSSHWKVELPYDND